MKKASLISVGNELLSGQTVDTNKAFLAGRLLELGIPVVRACAVPDEIEAIVEAIGLAVDQSDLIVITGGLGPTDDDLTRQALAEFLGVDLEFKPGLMRKICAFFEKRGLAISERNKIQAYLPAGTTGLDNDAGTAPGIWAEYEGKSIAVLPGVPVEMREMFEKEIVHRLENFVRGQGVFVLKLRCFGTGESNIAEMLGDRMLRGRNPLVNSTCGDGVITLHIIASGQDASTARSRVEKEADEIRGILGELVFGCDSQELAEAVGGLLRERGKTLATAESCTGGLIGKLITDIPGSSDYYTTGWVCYSNEAKTAQLEVAASLIEKYGAVSEEVARALAAGAMKHSAADYVLATTGIAGPGGETEQKPVGLVYIAVGDKQNIGVNRYIFPGSRERMRLRSALTALNLLRLKMRV